MCIGTWYNTERLPSHVKRSGIIDLGVSLSPKNRDKCTQKDIKKLRWDPILTGKIKTTKNMTDFFLLDGTETLHSVFKLFGTDEKLSLHHARDKALYGAESTDKANSRKDNNDMV